MATITLRSTKGSPLTNSEVDANFTALNTELGQKANATDAALSGNPTATTQTLDNSSTRIATTAFVQGLVNGVLSKSVAGGATVALTAIEAGNKILKFTGALTANISVTVPNTATGDWIVINATTGAYTLTFKTVSGTGVVVAQGRQSELISDGTNIISSTSHIETAYLGGASTALTPTAGDNSQRIATTAFVAGATVSKAATLSTTRAIAVAGDVSGTANFDGSAGISIDASITQQGKDAVLGDALALSIALG